MCDISSLRVNGPSEPGRLRDVCVCQWVKLRPIGFPDTLRNIAVRLRQEVAHRNRIIEYEWRAGYDARTSWREIICGTFKPLA